MYKRQFCDQRKLYNADGTPKSIHELDDATAAAVSGVDPDTGAIKTYDALRALDMAMKHVGLYEKDNHQKAEKLKFKVTFVKATQVNNK